MFLNDGVSEKDEARVRVCACVRACVWWGVLGTLSPGLEVTGRKYQRQLGNSPLTTQGRAVH